ncbi:uncharacterized protein At5g41620-like [Salvia miltiorrhiza]|uniref:uncharacterized protein At5g41620-like n=1 Tax=Salvia miltiorrhiza TaxID=226208 RepID=UPI0025AD3513|nr:uncharacterized protein At5g41620-like [Salvia miltiorrhiza]
MDREEKVKEGERKRGELMVEKLKRGILVGKREGKSTPPPTWKFGLVQTDGTLIPESNFSTNLNTLSARKLGANLWEMEPQLNHRVVKINKNGPILSNQRLEDKSSGIPKELDEEAAPPLSPSKQEASGISFRKQLAASLALHSARVDKVGQAHRPLSPASCSSSMEMAPPHRSAVSPNSSVVSNGKFGESSYSLKTSTELLKVLNKIWSLEEKHALDMSLVRALKRELEQSQARNQELVQEKKRDQNEIDHLMKQMTEYKVARKREQQRIKDAVKLVEDKLEDELKLRRHSESRHHKLAKELTQMKSSFSNVLRELDRERKARMLLEDLCDEFAKGIRDYEREVRVVRHKSGKDQIGREGNDRLILHISEAWLDERAQMKLADASDVSLQQSALDKLCLEIESFLREKQSDHSGTNVDVSSKTPSQSRALPHSLESFHLNEPASAPWRGNDEDDSIGMTSHRPHLSRGYSLKQANEEAASDGPNKETTRPKPGNEKARSRRGSSDPSCSQIQLDEQLHEKPHQQVKEGSTKSRNSNSNEASHHTMPRKTTREGNSRTTDADLRDARTTSRHPSSSTGQGSLGVEGFFDPSTFMGPASPARKWTAEASAGDPDISEPRARWRESAKPNTLKAKLIEARLEGQKSRTWKGLSKVD